jgi:hypothetical protein
VLKPFSPKQEYYEEGIIVGDETIKAITDSIALQGLAFDTPIEVYNSSNYYLPISVMTYEEAKDLKKMESSAGDINISFFNIMNVIFLDKDYNVIGNLLDRKASIILIEMPYFDRNDKDKEKTIKNIAYLIGFYDTNNDGKINSLDKHDLYLSDLNGQKLIKATENIDIETFDFIKSNTQLFIKYKERSYLREEHKRLKFGLYDIGKSEFNELLSLNKSINDIEKLLIKK